jgi:hypothetical protein
MKYEASGHLNLPLSINGNLKVKEESMKRVKTAYILLGVIFLCTCLVPMMAAAEDLPNYLKDRGPGTPTSMFGTYIRKAELIFYPFYECYYDNNYEYKPLEVGFGLDRDFRGRFRASETLVFVAYGLTDNLAIEAEAAWISASLYKSPSDPSGLPAKYKETGLGDVQAQLDWRWLKETDRRPMLFSYFEVDLPHHKNKPLIGTPDWEFKLGTGVSRGFTWGTLTARVGVTHAGNVTDLGEWALEYLKRISKTIRVYVGVEGGASDELSLIAEAQIHITPHLFIKLNNGFGLTSKSTDWAPEIGIMFSFSGRQE